MRIATACLLILGCTACMAAVGAQNGRAAKLLYVPRADVNVQVDAMPIEWTMIPPLAIGTREQVSHKAAWDGPKDLSALIRCMWGERAFHILIEVCDSDVVVKDDIDSSDRLKLELGEFSICIVPGTAKQDALAIDPQTNLRLLEDGSWSAIANGDGWIAELSIPWERLSRTRPRAEMRLPLNIELFDVDSAGSKKALSIADAETMQAVLKAKAPNELLSDANVLDGTCLVEVSSKELVPDTELQVEIMLPRVLPPVSGVEVSIVDSLGNEFEMKELRTERLGIFWRWTYSWLIPHDARGSYSLKVKLLTHGNKELAMLTRSAGIAMHITNLDLRQRIDELVLEARSQTFRARKLGDKVACGRWATLWFHAGKLLNDFVRMTNEEPTVDAARAFQARLNGLQEMRDKILSGKDPFDGRTGVIERAYLSDLDDTLQPFCVYIPPIYYDVLLGRKIKLPREFERLLEEDEELKKAIDFDAFKSRGFPMVVQLHGLGGTYEISAPSPSSPLWGVIVLSPHGRGPTDYKVWGEVDVICVIKEAMRTYRVDEDRIYMTGVSMGGTGCWQIATHYPDLFAAIAPVCGNADHRVWEKEWNWGQPERTFMTDVRNFMENCESPVFLAENLMHVPVYCVHGDADNIVPVGHSRSMVGRLRELGYSVIYDEQKGVGHGGFHAGTFEKLHAWLLKQLRNRHPKRVVYKTGWLRYKGAYWVEINRFERYLNFATIDAEVVAPNAVSIRTSNVAHFTLHLNDNIVDTTKPVSISIDGELIYHGGVGRDRMLSFAKRKLQDGTSQWAASTPPHGLVKSSNLEGPIEAAFLSRFIIAYGTGGDDGKEIEVSEAEAKKLAAHWARWANGKAIVKSDVDVTDSDLADANLILIGNPRCNSIIRRINAFLPIRFDVNGSAVVMANGLRFDGDDVGVNMVYPNPLNPKRLVVILGGTSWKGTFDVVRRFDNWFDWGVLDHRKWFDFAIYDARTRDPETFLSVGFFDQDWALSDELTFFGDAKLRQAAPPQLPSDRQWASSGERVVYLSDLKPIGFSSDKGPLGIDRTTNGYKLTLCGRQYAKGLSAHPDAEIVYDIGGRFKAFECVVGIDTSGEKPVSRAREQAETVTFQIFGDGKLLAEVTDVKWNTPPKRITVSVEGVRILRLVAKKQGGARWLYGKVDFADAKLINDVIHRSNEVGIHAFAKALSAGEPLIVQRNLAEEAELTDGWKMRPAEWGEGFEMGWHEKPFGEAAKHLEGQDKGDGKQLGEQEEPRFEPFGESPYLQQRFDGYEWLEEAERREKLKGIELQVSLPMSVHGCLVEYGMLQDPCRQSKTSALNQERTLERITLTANDVGEFEWWLQKTFPVPEDWRYRNVLLELGGVSYQADVWVNGKPVGRVVGMWHGRTFDITPLLKFGEENLLAVRLTDREVPWTCPPKRIDAPKPDEALLPAVFDGDCGGMVLTPIGIWQPIKLRTTGICALSNLRVRTLSASLHEAVVRITVTATNMHHEKPIKVILRGQVGGCGFVWVQLLEPKALQIDAGKACEVIWDVRIANPKLWWTHDISQPSLYQVSIITELDGGIITDRLSCEFGIRGIEIAPAQAAIKIRGSMVRLNGGKLVHLKGTAWVVPDQLLRLDEARYEMLLKKLAQLGFNCLYVSGKTLPESELFYRLCNRYGIFVIQELPIGAIDLSRFEQDMLIEVAKQLVMRLRNHPCLLLWSLGISKTQEAQGGEFAHRLLEAIASVDEERPILTRLESGRQNEVNPRANVSLDNAASVEPLLLLVESPMRMANGVDDIEGWFSAKVAIERSLLCADGGGFIIGQFNEPCMGSGMALVRYDGRVTPLTHAFSRALRSKFALAFDGETIRVSLSANAKGQSDAALQVIACDERGGIRQSVVPLLKLHPGERRIINLESLQVGLFGECLIAAAVHALGNRTPLSVSTFGSLEIARRLAAINGKDVKRTAAAPARVKAIWITKDVNAAGRMAAAMSTIGTQIKVVPDEDLMGNEKVFIDTLSDFEALIIDGDCVKSLIQAGVDKQIGDAITEAVWKGLGLIFNGLPMAQLGEEPMRGYLPSLMPALLICDAAGDEVEVGLKVEETEHPALKWLNATDMKVRRCQLRAFARKGTIVLISDSLGVPMLVESAYGKGRVLAWTTGIAGNSNLVPTSLAQRAFASTLWYACKASFVAMRELWEMLRVTTYEPTEQYKQSEGERQFETPIFGEQRGVGAQQYEEGEGWRQQERQPLERKEHEVNSGLARGRIGLIEISIEAKAEAIEDQLSFNLRVRNGYPFPIPAILIDGEFDGMPIETDDNLFDLMPAGEQVVRLSLRKGLIQVEGKELKVHILTPVGGLQLSASLTIQ